MGEARRDSTTRERDESVAKGSFVGSIDTVVTVVFAAADDPGDDDVAGDCKGKRVLRSPGKSSRPSRRRIWTCVREVSTVRHISSAVSKDS